jgi:hypothetical protein
MKKIILSIFIMIISLFPFKNASGQWVLIPDSNFRNAIAVLVPAAISGNNMDTTNAQIITMTSLNVSNKQIQNLSGIQYFDQLTALYCSSSAITTIPALPSSLHVLDCHINNLNSLPVLPSTLQTLNCGSNHITSLPDLPASLQILDCDNNQLTVLPDLDFTSIQHLIANDNQLTSLPPLPSTLWDLYCNNNQLTSLPALPSPLEVLFCYNNNVVSLPSLPSSLLELRCEQNYLTSIPPLPSLLQVFWCYSNLLTSLPSLPAGLEILYCEGNPLTSLPSLPSSLYSINCGSCQLTSLPPLPTSLYELHCGGNQLASLPTLPAALHILDCTLNQITCLPALPQGLFLIFGINAGYSCLPNIPASLSSIQGPSTICSQNQASVTPSGPTVFCSGGSVTLNANTSSGLTYQWKNNGTTIAGATASSYNVTTTGSYTVIETSSAGCMGVASQPVSVTGRSLPSATITPAGPTTFCSGGSVVLNAPTSANKTYQWKKGVNLISGATLSSYTASTGGNYRVILTNTVTGCSKTTGSATVVTVNALPTATITPQGPTTFCAGGSVVLAANTGAGLTYKWKKGTNFISGATLPNYTATIGGRYKVEVTNSNGCLKTSAAVTVTVPCKEDGNVIETESSFDVNVYPNPTSADFLFRFENPGEENISIEVFDVIGNLILSGTIHNSIFIISGSSLSPGVYSAMIIGGNRKKIVKLIKIG